MPGGGPASGTEAILEAQKIKSQFMGIFVYYFFSIHMMTISKDLA